MIRFNRSQRALVDTLVTILSVSLYAGFIAYICVLATALETGFTQSLLGLAKRIYWEWHDYVRDHWLVIGTVLIFLLQPLVSAKRDQPLFSRGFFVDGLYAAMMIPFIGSVVPLYWDYLRYLLADGLGIAPGVLLEAVPGLAGLVIGYVVFDFLGWLHHLVRHKVPFFWRYHQIHHSQSEMNPLTSYRVHPVDWLNAQTIKILPAMIITDSFGVTISYILFHSLHDRLNHANIGSNLGPLRYIFVTPQSHRIHHSMRAEHAHSNFGVSLSIWDRIFGTQNDDEHSFPETGAPSRDFPVEQGQPLLALPSCFAKQLAHPFRPARARPTAIGPAP